MSDSPVDGALGELREIKIGSDPLTIWRKYPTNNCV
jgi:hypothetical protein